MDFPTRELRDAPCTSHPMHAPWCPVQVWREGREGQPTPSELLQVQPPRVHSQEDCGAQRMGRNHQHRVQGACLGQAAAHACSWPLQAVADATLHLLFCRATTPIPLQLASRLHATGQSKPGTRWAAVNWLAWFFKPAPAAPATCVGISTILLHCCFFLHRGPE